MVVGQLQRSATGTESPRGGELGASLQENFESLLAKLAKEHDREVSALQAQLEHLAAKPVIDISNGLFESTLGSNNSKEGNPLIVDSPTELGEALPATLPNHRAVQPPSHARPHPLAVPEPIDDPPSVAEERTPSSVPSSPTRDAENRRGSLSGKSNRNSVVQFHGEGNGEVKDEAVSEVNHVQSDGPRRNSGGAAKPGTNRPSVINKKSSVTFHEEDCADESQDVGGAAADEREAPMGPAMSDKGSNESGGNKDMKPSLVRRSRSLVEVAKVIQAREGREGRRRQSACAPLFGARHGQITTGNRRRPSATSPKKALAKVDTAFTKEREPMSQPQPTAGADDDDDGKLDLDETIGATGLPPALRRGASNMLRARSFVSVGGEGGDEGVNTHNLATKEAWMPGAHQRKLSVKSSGRLTMANLDKKLQEMDRMPEVKYTGPLRHFIAMPTSPRRIFWEMIAALAITFDVVMVPVVIVFEPEETKLLQIVDWCTLIFWTLNIPLSFFVGVIHDGVLLMSPTSIAEQYIKTWLAIDVLAVVPDWIFKLVERRGAYAKSFRVLRISRTVRLLRLLKLRWIMEIINDWLHTEATDIVANIAKMMVILLLMCHYVACCWFALGDSTSGKWVEHYVIEDDMWEDQWLTAFHWAVAQFTQTAMYVQPQTRNERIFTVLVVIITLLAFSYTIGAITSYLGQLRTIKEDGSKQLWIARRFLRAHDVPTHLNIRILRYLEKEWERARRALSLEGIPIFGYLSEQLHNELLCAVCLPHLRPHPFFNKVMDLSELVMQRLAAKCISQKTLAGGDMLFVPYDSPAHMGTVTRGQITYVKVDLRNREHTYHLEKGKGWVTEHTLWTDDWVCLGEARAETDCELQLVSAETFSEVLSPLPNLVNLAGKYAAAFMESLNHTSGDELLDIILLEEVIDLATPVIRDYDAEFANSSPVASSTARPRYLERALSFFSRGIVGGAQNQG